MIVFEDGQHDIGVRCAEDLSDKATSMGLADKPVLLGMAPPCHNDAGWHLAYDMYNDTLVLICKECKTPCGAVRVARKRRAS